VAKLSKITKNGVFLHNAGAFQVHFLCVWGGLKYFEADCCNIVDLGWVDFLVLHKRVEFIEHLNDGQISDLTKFFAEMKAGLVIEPADEGLGSVGVQQKFITGLKLYSLLNIFGFFKDSKQRASYLQLLRLFAGPDEDRIWMPRTGKS
jgi:hypothetical protein